MFNIYLRLALSFLMTGLDLAIKNPESRLQAKETAHQIFLSILMQYPEFAMDLHTRALDIQSPNVVK